MTDTALRNLHWARRLIASLAAGGVRQAVISPGLRSTPLVLACEGQPGLRIWIQVDERCAAFFALGLARASGTPTVLVATSGSAPAHWHPAVIEAAHSHVPLILLSADRPPALHHCGANQTTDQGQLFGPHLRGFYAPGIPQQDAAPVAAIGRQAVELSQWPDPGPVQINLPFADPLVPRRLPPLPPPPAPPCHPPAAGAVAEDAEVAALARELSGRRVVIVCGPNDYAVGFASHVSALATVLDAPVFADPLSGLRFGGHDRHRVLCRYDAFLRWTDTEAAPEIIVRLGAAPVSKTLLEWLQAQTAAQWLIHSFPDTPDPAHRLTRVIRTDPASWCQQLLRHDLDAAPKGWFDALRRGEEMAARAADAPTEGPPFEGQLIAELLAEVPPHSLLFSGNSMPVRQFDAWSGTLDKPLRLIANRGVSGIDGNISTLLGLAAGGDQPVIGLIGDLAFYHDMNGLLAARQGIDAVLVVINNGGGGIFGYLPQADLPDFEAHWLTPTGLELVHAAKLYALPFHRIRRQAEFRPALRAALAEKGVSLLEVMVDRDYSIARHRQYWSKAGA